VALRLRPILASARRRGASEAALGGDAGASGGAGAGRRADGEAAREEGAGVPLVAGALAAFASTLGSSWLIGQVERDRSLLPYAAYRTALAAVVVRRLRKNQADGRRLRRGRG
jgi:hypothetical protein